MTFLWHGLTEQGAQVPIQVDDQGRVVAAPTGAPDPAELVHAWASVAGDGSLKSQFNIANVVFTGPNRYDVFFTNSAPNANYVVSLASDVGQSAYISMGSKTPAAFSYYVRATTTGGDIAAAVDVIVCAPSS